ncbi:MAG TPA: glycoside hydrolase domain-containing protein [Armatimonadota bacterium]|nr:glycoside hydrolase domain-containing protein [Armatimonadota bacterium]
MCARLAFLMVSAIVISAAAFGAQTEREAAGADFKVWVADPLIKILPNSPVPADREPAIRIDAVRNEYESAQVVVTAYRDIGKLAVKVSPLEGPSRAAPRIEAHFLGFIPVEKGTTDTPPEHLIVQAPADIPDPLLDARSVSVKAGRNQPVWLTIFVPKGAAPGAYSGTVELIADSASTAVPLSIRVHPVTLPDERTLYLTNWFSTGIIAGAHGLERWSEPFWKMLGAYARCMADHRQNVVITRIFELITARDDGNGNLTFDFSKFDRWVELFKRVGVIGIIEGSHLAGRGEWEAKNFDAYWPVITNPDGSVRGNPPVKATSDEERAFLSQFLPALQKHLEEKGWIDIYLQHLTDEPIAVNAESYKKLASFVREFAPKLRTIDASMCTEIAGSIDIWVPLPPELEAKMRFFQERKKAGEEVWFYTCLVPKGKYMNRFLDSPLLKVRLMHWMNFKYGLTGYLHWGFNHWRGDPFTDLQSDWIPPGDSAHRVPRQARPSELHPPGSAARRRRGLRAAQAPGEEKPKESPKDMRFRGALYD